MKLPIGACVCGTTHDILVPLLWLRHGTRVPKSRRALLSQNGVSHPGTHNVRSLNAALKSYHCYRTQKSNMQKEVTLDMPKISTYLLLSVTSEEKTVSHLEAS